MFGISTRNVKGSDVQLSGIVVGKPVRKILIRPGQDIQALCSSRGSLMEYRWVAGVLPGRNSYPVDYIFSRQVVIGELLRERYAVPCSAWFVNRSDKAYAVYPIKKQTLYIAALRQGSSVVVISIPAEGKLRGISSDMPLVLGSGAAKSWLMPGQWSREDLVERMRPIRSEMLDFYCTRGDSGALYAAEDQLPYLLAPRSLSFVQRVNQMCREDAEKRAKEILSDKRAISRDHELRWKRISGEDIRGKLKDDEQQT